MHTFMDDIFGFGANGNMNINIIVIRERWFNKNSLGLENSRIFHKVNKFHSISAVAQRMFNLSLLQFVFKSAMIGSKKPKEDL